MLLTLLALAQAADCPDVTPVLPDTAFDGTRLVSDQVWFVARYKHDGELAWARRGGGQVAISGDGYERRDPVVGRPRGRHVRSRRRQKDYGEGPQPHPSVLCCDPGMRQKQVPAPPENSSINGRSSPASRSSIRLKRTATNVSGRNPAAASAHAM